MSDTELTIDQKIAVARIVTDLMISGIERRNGIGAMMHTVPGGPLFPDTFEAAYHRLVVLLKAPDQQ
ncbi:hypothetical protein FPF74_22600 [Salmonella enterica subsp. enterica]|nr:hypothetical protein [Salmonella enterica subsp. enterica serovar Bredeney]